MSQRTIERKGRITTLKENPNGRICPALVVFGIMLGIANIIEFIGLSIASYFPLIIMILLLSPIDESILHWEVKSVRHILLFLLIFEAIWAGLSVLTLDMFAPLFTYPILLIRGVLFNRIGNMVRKNPFLIRNENGMKATSTLNYITGMLFLIAGTGEMGAFLGLVPLIPLIHTIAIILGCMAGIGIAVSCSLSHQIFNLNKKRKRSEKEGE